MRILILFLFILFCINSNAIQFVHFIGYQIIAEPLKTFETDLLYEECGNECILSEEPECIGFEYFEMKCTLLKNVRDIIVNRFACHLYMYDRRPEIDFTGMNLTDFEKIIFSNAYLNHSCPQGSTDEITQCSIEVTEAKCLEYSSFFNATFDGSKCVFPPFNRPEFYCTSALSSVENWIYQNDDEQYCYFKITSSPSSLPDMATFKQKCSAVSSNSFPVSICSRAENDFFLEIIDATSTMIGLYLPTAANKPSRIYEWSDGNVCQYRNWLSSDPNSYMTDIETVTQIDSNGKWLDTNLTGFPTNLFCKTTALSLQEYAASCTTLDNCAQLN